MKKVLLALVILLTSIGLYAQNDECNRLFLHQKGQNVAIYNMNKIDSLSFAKTGAADNLILHNSNGTKEVFAVDNLDSIIFKNVEGAVAADVNIIDYSTNHVKFDITRTASCTGFKLMCMDYNSISYLSDNDIAKYISENATETYYQDFEGVEISGLNLAHDTEYAIVTVGIDEYELFCDVTKARFVTHSANLVGDPKVTIEVTQNELNEDNKCDFTLSFTPNSATSKYSIFIAEAGVTEYQFVLFKTMEGWENLGDMIEGWGLEFDKKDSYQYTNETPGALYEVYIQARDVNGTRAPYQVFKFRTQGLGGEGIAKVDIKLGEYTLEEWMNEEYEWELMPSQFFTFTPNDQTNAYRFDVMLESTYKSDIEGFHEELCSDPFMPTDGWFQYETLTTDYQIDPGLKCVAIAAAKNSLGEWGPVTELYFTTPDEIPGEGPGEEPDDEPETKVTLAADKDIVKTNGTDKITFTVWADGEVVTNDAVIFNVTEGKNLNGNTFSTETIGTYVFYATYNGIRSAEISISATEVRVYAPGDLYDVNGVKGVVFRVEDGGISGYIMSMDEAYLQWSTENVWVNCVAGRGDWNTEDMLKKGADKYPAAKWCADHGDGWFMPSSRELNWMWDAVSNGTHVYDKEFIKLYNDKLDDPISEDYYWSSNETSEDMAEVVVFIDNSVVCLNPTKSSCFLVRAVRKF